MPAKKATVKTGKSRKSAPPKARRSKVYTISLPPDLAARAEAIAKAESRTMSEIFRDAFRAYEAPRLPKWLEEARAYAATRNPMGYTEEDLPRLIREVRAEMAAEQAQKVRKAG
ncbi:MAG: ribbon-helix-helix protein, CopG family [Acidobacteriaceae bacterium]